MSTTRTRRRLTGVLASLALSMIAMTGLSGAAQAAQGHSAAESADLQVAASSHGCPYGAVCVYPSAGWNGGNPTYVFYSYGAHKIYNQYGTHRIYNNQYGDAYASACRGSSGNDCRAAIRPGTYSDTYLTPINSIRLFQG